MQHISEANTNAYIRINYVCNDKIKKNHILEKSKKSHWASGESKVSDLLWSKILLYQLLKMNAFMRHYHELNVDIITQDAVYDKIFFEHF